MTTFQKYKSRNLPEQILRKDICCKKQVELIYTYDEHQLIHIDCQKYTFLILTALFAALLSLLRLDKMEVQEQLSVFMDNDVSSIKQNSYFQFNRKIGCGIFDRNFMLSQKRKILSDQILDALKNKDKRVSIVHYKQQWAQVFKYMQFCEVDELFIYLSDYPHIIRDISNTVFRNISQMHICNNNIKSIEALAKMDLRTLYVLDLCVNQITSISPLIMCNFPCLAGLYLKRNRILSMQPLKQCSMPILDIIRLQCYEDNVMDYDISWASRISSPRVREICIESEYRICQLKHRKILRKKYAKLIVLINHKTIPPTAK